MPQKSKHFPPVLSLLALSLMASVSLANEGVISSIDNRKAELTSLSNHIWDLAEVGYLEHKSSAALQATLSKEGFSIETGVGDIPTAFIASYGSGEPVIAVMGEFDALPGISQAAVPYPEKIPGKTAAQACGHHLFGAGSAGACLLYTSPSPRD